MAFHDIILGEIKKRFNEVVETGEDIVGGAEMLFGETLVGGGDVFGLGPAIETQLGNVGRRERRQADARRLAEEEVERERLLVEQRQFDFLTDVAASQAALAGSPGRGGDAGGDAQRAIGGGTSTPFSEEDLLGL